MDLETGVYCQGLGMDCSSDIKVNEELEIINELYSADSGKVLNWQELWESASLGTSVHTSIHS